MSKSSFGLIVGIVLIVLLVGVITIQVGKSNPISSNSSSIIPTAIISQVTPKNTNTVSSQTLPPQAKITPIHHEPEGGPAIKPSRNDVNSLDSNTPAFSAKEVEVYVQTHPEADTVAGSKYTVEKVEFIKTKDLKSRVDTNFADERLLCLVTLHGDFAISTPWQTQSVTQHTAYQIFDAHTGNLLEELVGEASQP